MKTRCREKKEGAGWYLYPVEENCSIIMNGLWVIYESKRLTHVLISLCWGDNALSSSTLNRYFPLCGKMLSSSNLRINLLFRFFD